MSREELVWQNTENLIKKLQSDSSELEYNLVDEIFGVENFDKITIALSENSCLQSIQIRNWIRKGSQGRSNNIGLVDAIVKGCINHRTLTSLLIENCDFENGGAVSISELLAKSKKLTYFGVHDCFFAQDDKHESFGSHLVNGLKENKSLARFSLVKVSLESSQLIQITQAIGKLDTLRVLTFSLIQCTESVLNQVIESILPIMPQLVILTMSDMTISAKSLERLFPIDIIPIKLQRLIFSNADFGDRGAFHISKLINKMPLKFLQMTFCQIRDDGIMHLAKALEDNKTLTSLNLGDNLFTDDGLKAILDATAKSNHLVSLSIEPRTESLITLPSTIVSDFIGLNCRLAKLYFTSSTYHYEKSRIGSIHEVDVNPKMLRINTNLVQYSSITINKTLAKELSDVKVRNQGYVMFRDRYKKIFPLMSRLFTVPCVGADVHVFFETSSETLSNQN